jgi:hypothetical protein
MGEEEDDEDEYGDDYELEEDEEDDDEDDFDEDDYEPDEDDDDNDEDDYGSGKYSSIVKVHPKINRIDSSTQPHIIHSGSSEMLPATQPPQLLEYIDVETF